MARMDRSTAKIVIFVASNEMTKSKVWLQFSALLEGTGNCGPWSLLKGEIRTTLSPGRGHGVGREPPSAGVPPPPGGKARLPAAAGPASFSVVQEVISEWQQAASNVLVAVGRRFINTVMEEVLTKFQPGVLPHYFVVRTFASLSVANGQWWLCRL